MTRTRLFLAGLFAGPALACADVPPADTAASAPGTAPRFDCSRVDADIAHAQEARRVALEQGESAWKAVVPFVVLARKASSKSAAGEADKRLAELRQQARQQGCGGHVG